ncbi:unnamed protein product, partial [Sphagnum troendelagicum]
LHILLFPLKKLRKDSTKCFLNFLKENLLLFPSFIYFSLSLSSLSLVSHQSTENLRRKEKNGKYIG